MPQETKAQSREALRTLVRQRLREAGFRGRKHLVPGYTKEAFRRVHVQAREHELAKRQPRIEQVWREKGHWFANGSEVDVERIRPRLQVINPEEDWNDLFYLARLTWSLPYSQGFGRRIRCLIWDDHTRSLMGIAGLQSPPLDFPLRDAEVRFPKKQKTFWANQMMDAYVVGAVPPFNDLLAGKLAAMSLASNEVRRAYQYRYANSTTLMEERHIPARLLGFTTTSAYGRSSQYDRIRDHKGATIYRELGEIGETTGSYHFNGLYHMLRDYLVANGSDRQWNGYGTGPRVRMQVVRQGLRALKLPQTLVKHSVPRIVYLVENVRNLDALVSGESSRPSFHDRPFADLASHWKTRWLNPRWQRLQEELNRADAVLSFDSQSILRGLRRPTPGIERRRVPPVTE